MLFGNAGVVAASGKDAAWDVGVFSYLSKSFSVSTQESAPMGLAFGDSGSKMYVVGSSSDTVYQYALTTPWDIATASYASKSKDVSSETVIPTGIFFKPDGTKMYIVDNAGDDVYQYTLSVAWDVSTASFDTGKVGALAGLSPYQIYITSDGATLYQVNNANDRVYQHTLSTPWDISTISSVSFLSVTATENSPVGLFFKPDETKMFVAGLGTNSITQWNISSAGDITTGSYSGTSLDLSSQTTTVRGIYLKDDGLAAYAINQGDGTILQYGVA